MKNLIILGATSEISRYFAMEAISNGYRPVLCGRSFDRIKVIADDIKVRTSTDFDIPLYEFDSLDYQSHTNILTIIQNDLQTIDALFIACGVMYSQRECEENPLKAIEMFNINFSGIINFILEMQKKDNLSLDFISVISSVAGDRGRSANYFYGASKAALTVFMEGMRAKLSGSNILIQTVKPGPMATEMTRGLDKLPFIIPASKAARLIFKAINKRQTTVYIPFLWFIIMYIIKLIPEFIFKKMKI